MSQATIVSVVAQSHSALATAIQANLDLALDYYVIGGSVQYDAKHEQLGCLMAIGAVPLSSETNQFKTLTATRTILASETGSTFLLSAATEFVSTLPVAAAGLRYTFIVGAAPSGASYTVVTASSANIIKGLQQSVFGDAGDFGTADDTISFVDSQAVAGDRVDVVSDGTSWFAYANSKVAAGVTFTQAS